MTVFLGFIGSSGLSLALTIQRLSDGFFWNPTAIAFQAAPSYANKRIGLTEGSAENTGSYTASVNSLGSPARCAVRIHDEGNGNQVIGMTHIEVHNSEEASNDDNKALSEMSSIPASPSQREMIQLLFQRWLYGHKITKATGVIDLLKADNVTILGSQATSESASEQTVGKLI